MSQTLQNIRVLQGQGLRTPHLSLALSSVATLASHSLPELGCKAGICQHSHTCFKNLDHHLFLRPQVHTLSR